jgi:hypothetical protein
MKIGNSISRQDLEQFFDECDPRVVVSGFTHNAARTEARFQPEELKGFFSDLDFRLEIQNKSKSQLDRHLASEFSVFKFINPDENGLSDILVMLLNPRGVHGQQDLFLKLFIDRLGRSSEPNMHDTKVVREAPTHAIGRFRRRIDILVTSDHLALAVENKVDAGEQQDQMKDYHDHIQRLPQTDYCLVFLTRDGREPESIPTDTATKLRGEHLLFELSYEKDIRQWLEECRRGCEAENIRYFLADFIHYIKTHLSSQQPEEE